MNVTVIRARDLTADQMREWDRIQQASPDLASPYFCPEFTASVAAVRTDVRLAVLRDGDRIVGFFPFQRNWLGIGKPVGGPLSDYHGLIIEPGTEVNVRALLRACGLVVWDFNHLVASQKAFEPYRKATDESPYMDLSRGYESYVAERRDAGTREITEALRKRRKLEREVGPVRFEAEVADPRVLAELAKWKSQQYIGSGLVNVFGFGWTLRLLERIHRMQGPGFAGVLSALYAGDALLAAHMGMRSRTVWHYWFPAYGQEFARYSPGLILLLDMAQYAPTLGIRAIDLGKGDSRYKRSLMSGSVPLMEGSAQRPSLVARLRKLADQTEAFVRRTPLAVPARVPGRLLLRIKRRLRFR